MARRRHGFMAKLLALVVLGLVIVGAWTIWKWRGTQDTLDHVERAAKAAHRAW